jgi:hypothetical protein
VLAVKPSSNPAVYSREIVAFERQNHKNNSRGTDGSCGHDQEAAAAGPQRTVLLILLFLLARTGSLRTLGDICGRIKEYAVGSSLWDDLGFVLDGG